MKKKPVADIAVATPRAQLRQGKQSGPPSPARKVLVPAKPAPMPDYQSGSTLGGVSPAGKTRGVSIGGRPATPARKLFVPEKPPAIPLRDLLYPDGDFMVPPRDPCDQCGARPGRPHGQDCPYWPWPVGPIADPAYRPALATSMMAPVGTCADCGRAGIQGWSGASHLLHPGQETPAMVEQDRRVHQWWCPWFQAHPGVTPF